MKVADLYRNVPSGDLFEALFELYPHHEKNRLGCYKAYSLIKIIEAFIPTTTKCVVEHVYREHENLDPDDFIDVYGVDPETEPDQWGRKGEDVSFGLDFRKWGEWLNMELIVKTKDPRCDSDAKVLSHIFYEMTWHGYDEQQIADEFDGLRKQVEEIENGTAELVEFDIDVFEYDSDRC